MAAPARWISRHAAWIVAGTVVLLALSGLYAGNLADRLSGGGWTVPGSEETRAARAQDAGFVGRGSATVTLLIHDDRFAAPAPEFAQRIAEVHREVAADPRLQVHSLVGFASLPPPQRDEFLGKDGRTTLTTLDLGLDEGAAKRVIPQVERELSKYRADGLRVHLVGQNAAFGAVNEVGAEGLIRAELILLPLVLIILLVLYRSVVAALVSLVVSVTAIVVAMGALTWLAGVVELNVVVQSIATMLGLGVGVDYSLIVIRRFIDELSAGPVHGALDTTLRTAGRTVIASGGTVAVALATLLIIDIPVIHSVAIAAIIVVALAVLASVVVLPAVLALLGDRITAGRVPWLPTSRERARRRWTRLARAVLRRPVPALLITSIPLLALAVPALSLQTFNVDASVLPAGSSVRAGYELAEQQYGRGAVEPVLVVLESDEPFSRTADFDRIEQLVGRFAELPHVTRVAAPVTLLRTVMPADPVAALSPAVFDRLSPQTRAAIDHFVAADRRTVAVDVFTDERAGDADLKSVLADVRSVAAEYAPPGWRVSVGGPAADGFAATHRIATATPMVIATMLAAIYLLLVVTFRSLLLPLKAIALNLLSVAATIGAVVLIFQHGLAADLLGVASVGPIQNFVPILLVAVLFSLSTDYEVFLLSRVRERYQQTGDNDESVVFGLVETGPLISGAAVLMATIFAAFMAIPLVSVQQTGMAMAIGIVIDATVVRLVMVPAAMRLMGRWNWWLPGVSHRDQLPVTAAVSPLS